LKDGHCLRDHALAALRHLANRRIAEFEATSPTTLVQMVDITRPLLTDEPTRNIDLVWRARSFGCSPRSSRNTPRRTFAALCR
jgi:hypothetical protein